MAEAERKTLVIDEKWVIVTRPLDGIWWIRNNKLKGLIIPVLRICEGVFASYIKFIKSYIMKEHINAAEVISRNINFLTKETILQDMVFVLLFHQ